MSDSHSTYDVFLSYNSRDHEVVERVAKALGERGCEYFIDRWYLQAGKNWVEALERALAGSRSVVVFVGPHEMGRWQQRERAWALNRQAGDSEYRVIPVLLPGSEPPLGFLALEMWVDLRKDPTDVTQIDALAAAIRGEALNREGRLDPRATICPYRGLLTFREEDADFFFGREAYTEQLLKLVDREALVAVVGASGSGKSSLVSAGLIPHLRSDESDHVWEVVRMVPDVDPFYSFSEAIIPLTDPQFRGQELEEKIHEIANDLRQNEPQTPLWGRINAVRRAQPGTERILLFVDQWEELYSQCDDDHTRERFIDELLEATARKHSPLSVVFTMRSDFYTYLMQHRKLLDRLVSSELKLGPMNAAELHSVITKPGEVVGLTFQDGLCERIQEDAGDETGRLALLEFALEELWKRRRGDGQLTHGAYQDLGRLGGAIAKRAEQIWNDLDETAQSVMPGLFRRLVQAGASVEEDSRRRAELGDLDETSQRVARSLADERLLVTTQQQQAPVVERGGEAAGRETVEVAHEELLRRWERLAEWINEDRQFLQWRSRLAPLVREYERDPEAALLRGNALRESRRYVPSRADELEAGDREFVLASQRADRQRKLRIASASSLSVVVIALLMIVGLRFQEERDRSAAIRRIVEEVQQELDAPLHEWDGDVLQTTAESLKELRTLDDGLADQWWNRVIEKIETDLAGGPPIRTIGEYQRLEGLFQQLQRLDTAAGQRLAELFPRRLPLLTDRAAAFDASTIRQFGARIQRNPEDLRFGEPVDLVLSEILSDEQMASLHQEAAIEVSFDTHWQDARTLSIQLSTAEDSGIVFSLSALPLQILEDIEPDSDDYDDVPTMGMQIAAGEPLSLQISEMQSRAFGSSILAQRNVTITGDPVRIYAVRLRNELSITLNDRSALRFVMLEPADPREQVQVKLDWPADVGITDLQLYGFKRTQNHDGFDEADAAYLDDELVVASELYHRLGNEFESLDDLRREALVKRARCLIRLGPDHEEELHEICDLLQEDDGQGDKWWHAAAAACRIEFVLVHHDEPESIRAVLEEALRDSSPDQIFTVMPLSERRRIFDELSRSWGFSDVHYMLAYIPNRSEKLSQLLDLLPFVTSDKYERLMYRWRLIDAYHLEENSLLAIQEAREALREASALMQQGLIEPEEVVAIARDYVWLRIQSGEYHDALTLINELDNEVFSGCAIAQGLLQIERCRVHASRDDRDDWEEARASIELFFAGLDEGRYQESDFAYCEYAEACLLRGWAAERAGESADDVVDYWEEGRYKTWEQGNPQPLLHTGITGKLLRDNLRSNMIASALCSLTQDVTDNELKFLVASLLLDPSVEGPVHRITEKYLDRWFPSPYLRRLVLEIYSSDLGAEILQDRVLGRYNFHKYHTMPGAWMITTGIKVELPSEDFPTELERKTLDGLVDLFHLFLKGHVSEHDVVNLMAAWAGVDKPPLGTGRRRRPEGWRGARQMLERLREEQLIDDEIVALCAYFIGRREHIRATVIDEDYEGDWSLDDARELLRYSVDNAPSSSLVRDLAARYLAEIESTLMQLTE